MNSIVTGALAFLWVAVSFWVGGFNFDSRGELALALWTTGSIVAWGAYKMAKERP